MRAFRKFAAWLARPTREQLLAQAVAERDQAFRQYCATKGREDTRGMGAATQRLKQATTKLMSLEVGR